MEIVRKYSAVKQKITNHDRFFSACIWGGTISCALHIEMFCFGFNSEVHDHSKRNI
jgi:hypothetical protein